MKNALMAGAVALLGVAGPSVAGPCTAGDGGSGTYSKFAVAADQPLASEAGAEILRAGGNAVDAAVAASLALSVVRPFSCGLGGGGFMVVAGVRARGAPSAPGNASSRAEGVAINYRETAPAAVGKAYFEGLDDEAASTRGGKACAVPGTVAGLMHALDKYGSMDRARVCAPAIRLAREGFAVDAAYAGAATGLIAQFEKHPEWKDRFAFTWERFLGGGHVAAGDIVKLPEQARVLELIAERGPDGFYKGEVGAALIGAVRGAGGEMTPGDLAGFTVTESPALRIDFAGRTFLTMPPPSSGGLAMAQVFGLLARKDLPRFAPGGAEENAAAYTQLVVEGFKSAFADRAAWLGDPAFVDVPVTRLISGAYLDGLAKIIRIGRTQGPEMYGTRPDDPAGQEPEQLQRDHGTSHLCVIDAHGGAAACTETINLHFGSLVSSAELGFCLNDEMDDFTTRSGKANAFGLLQSDRNLPEPGKRPLSSMSPTVVIGADGAPEAVAGGSGGPRIITATVQALLNALVRADSAERAVSRGRVHHQWMPDQLEIEPSFDERQAGLGVDKWMRKVGHRVVEAGPTEVASVQLIVRRGATLEAACDPRKGGRPAGE